MREERVTINIINWLEANGWNIICYDFPQSGTGFLLHPDSETNRISKNKGGIIPDILATRETTALFFENKDRFVLSDFDKIREIKINGNYSKSLNKILAGCNVSGVLYGIGIPAIEKYVNRSLDHIGDIDFLISTTEEGTVNINFDRTGVFP